MCTCRRGQKNRGDDDEGTSIALGIMTEGGLKGGASCSHRAKKSLFKMKEARKALKETKERRCGDCSRLAAKNEPLPESASKDILMCITCGRFSCEEHGKSHCANIATDDGHPFFFSMEKGVLRCHPCDVDLEPLEDPEDLVKKFYNDYNAFNKTRTDAEEKKREAKTAAEKVKVEGKPEPAPPPPPPPAATASSSKNLLKKENGVDKMPTRNGAVQKASMAGFEEIETLIPVKGLANLGNTCFFNSVMQCIMHTHHLDYYFRRFGRVNKLNFDRRQTITIGEEKIDLEPVTMPIPDEDSPLNDVVRAFISEFRHGHSPAPGNVFSQISKKAPRFKGWQQQDAHELLRYLLDGLRSEEQERYKTAIATYLQVPKQTRKNTDPATIKKAKGYLQAAGRPLLDAVFGGTLLQTIRCSECNHVSQAMEQFLDLSVPMSANPMSARLAAAGGGAAKQPSAHQRKKVEKAAKKASRQQARKTAAQKKVGGVEATTAGAGQQLESSDGEEGPETESETESEEEEEEIDRQVEEEEQERLVGGRANGGVVNRLDMTKVLVDAPKEYRETRNVGACLLEFTAEELLAGTNSYECEECCLPRNKKLGAKGTEKKRVEAIKRYLIYEPPAILTLQLKRFQQVASYGGRLSTRKLGGHVDFPLLFDIAPFCCKNVQRVSAGQRSIYYSLYGVVVHSGDLSGGHYIAYVKSRHRVPHVREFLESAREGCVDAMASSSSHDASSTEPEKEQQLSKLTEAMTVNGTAEPTSPDGQWYYCSDSRVNAVAESRVLQAEAYILFYERLS